VSLRRRRCPERRAAGRTDAQLGRDDLRLGTRRSVYATSRRGGRVRCQRAGREQRLRGPRLELEITGLRGHLSARRITDAAWNREAAAGAGAPTPRQPCIQTMRSPDPPQSRAPYRARRVSWRSSAAAASALPTATGSLRDTDMRVSTGAVKIVKVRRVGNSNVVLIPREFEASGYTPGASVLVEELADGELRILPTDRVRERVRLSLIEWCASTRRRSKSSPTTTLTGSRRGGRGAVRGARSSSTSSLMTRSRFVPRSSAAPPCRRATICVGRQALEGALSRGDVADDLRPRLRPV
jgi:antitoxin component of MazEF toxin-antitoxin module